jgi:hypothetical protein
MTRNDCPAPSRLQDVFDGDVRDDAVSAHVRACPACRSATEAYAAIDAFVAVGVDDAPTAAEARAVMDGATERARRTARSFRARASTATAIALLSILGVVVALKFGATNREPVDVGAASTPFETTSVPAAEVDPVPDDEGASSSPTAPPTPPVTAEANAEAASRPSRLPPATFDEAVSAIFAKERRVESLIRRVERLLVVEAPPFEAFVAVADRLLQEAGVRAEPAVHRALRSRGEPHAIVAPLYARMRGRDATAALVRCFVEATSDDAAAFALSALADRPGAREEAARLLRTGARESEFQAAVLVAKLRGDEGVATLRDALRSPERRERALEALCAAATDAALLEVARRLPSVEEWDSRAIDPDVALVERALASAADCGAKAASAAKAASRLSDRRRLLVLSGLAGDEAARPILEEALANRDERAAAFLALGLLRSEASTAAIVDALARTNERSTRRLGVFSLASLSGAEATAALADLLRRPDDRAAAFAALKDRPDATPRLFEALAYSETRRAAASELRRRFGPDAPSTDEYAVWDRYRRDRR